MPFKINISHQGKTLKKEIESEELIGKKIGETLQGKEISADLAGYELEITGTSDMAGFPGKKDIDGPELKRVLLTKGFGFKKKPRREGKKPRKFNKGLRMKKTLRGNVISPATVQINTKVKKEGSKKFEEMLPKKEVKAEAKAEVAATPAQ